MLLDLIAILFIIVLSFCLCMNDKVKNTISNCQMSHIFIGLSVIVFYKLASYFNLKKETNENKESFYNTTMSQDITDFISGVSTSIPSAEQVSNLTPEQLTAYNAKLDALTAQISQLQSQLALPPSSISTNKSNLQNLDIAAQQQYQQFQIDYLNRQIKNSQDIINAQSISESSTNYKPIKVFSSCVVSNADGSTTIEKPVASASSITSSKNTQSSFTNLPIAEFTNIINTIEQSNSQTKGPALNLSPKTGKIGEIIKNYIK